MAERPSLEDLLKDIPPEKLKQPCRDADLCEIALSVTKWKSIAPFLGLTKAEEENIEKDCGVNETQKIGMLRKWGERFGREANYSKLAQVFWKLKRVDLVEEVCKVLKTETSSSSSDEDGHRDLDSYAEYLRGRYRTKQLMSVIVQWPPPHTCKVFNLAMIHQQTIQRGPVDEDLIRLTQSGNVGEIMKKKNPIKLKNLFTLDDKDRKVILIEGAPGAGKSTLAWHICQRWESGELFQEFKVVVFVQLRDPAIQSARSLADILPDRSSKMCRELQSIYGRGVLFVLDGWDEYGPGLQPGSLFWNIICEPEDLNIHCSSLVITSRPVASGKLQHYASYRIEIVGFTPAEVKSYFTEALEGDRQTVRKLEEHLSERPVIQASCYLPLNAAFIVHLFLASNHILPHTLHEVFLLLVLCCIIRHLTRQAGKGRKIPDVSSLDDLPPEVQEPFNNICAMAFQGVMKNKATFSAMDLQSFNLPTELNPLSLIQGIQSYTALKMSVSWHFPHSSVQELLGAYHISKLPPAEQIKIFNDLFNQPRLATVFRFYAAFTKLQIRGIRDIVARIVQKREKPLLVNLLHGLHEVQDVLLCQFVASHLNGELDLQGSRLSPMDCLVVGYFLSCVCLTASGEFKVNLADCSLDNYKVSLLMKDLSSKCSHSTDIEKTTTGRSLIMDLSMNGIEKRGAEAISDVVKMNRSLQLLDLSFNPIAAGVMHLTESIRLNHSLLEINLGRCGITETQANLLATCLWEKNSLQTLILSENSLSDDGAVLIAENGLKFNACLKELNISACQFGDQGMKSLASSLEMNKSLKLLDLSRNDAITGVGLTALGKCLQRNEGLKRLKMFEGHGISKSDWKQFVLHLQENCHLKELEFCFRVFASPFASICELVQQEIELVNQTRREKNLPLLVLKDTRQ